MFSVSYLSSMSDTDTIRLGVFDGNCGHYQIIHYTLRKLQREKINGDIYQLFYFIVYLLILAHDIRKSLSIYCRIVSFLPQFQSEYRSLFSFRWKILRIDLINKFILIWKLQVNLEYGVVSSLLLH